MCSIGSSGMGLRRMMELWREFISEQRRRTTHSAKQKCVNACTPSDERSASQIHRYPVNRPTLYRQESECVRILKLGDVAVYLEQVFVRGT